MNTITIYGIPSFEKLNFRNHILTREQIVQNILRLNRLF